MKLKTDKIIIVDLEATCWTKDSEHEKQKRYSEIIEIGICNLYLETGDIKNKRSIYVKPVRSEISKFCIELTGITPAIIEEKGMGFKEALDFLIEEYKPKGCVWASYGAYDFNMLEKQCKDYKVINPLGRSHLNVKNIFALKQKLKGAVGMKRALQLIDEPLEGRHHSGADDAYNIAKIAKYILK